MGIIDTLVLKGKQAKGAIIREIRKINAPKKNEMYLIAIPKNFLNLFSVCKVTGKKAYSLRVDLACNISNDCVYGDGGQSLQDFLNKNAVKKCMDLDKKGNPKLLKKVKVDIDV